MSSALVKFVTQFHIHQRGKEGSLQAVDKNKEKSGAVWGFPLHSPFYKVTSIRDHLSSGQSHISPCFVCFSAMSGKKGEDSEESKVKEERVGMQREGQNMAVRDICKDSR